MVNSVESFNIESWTYLGIDITVVFVRFFGRWRSVGLRGMSADDFLMIIAMLLYTAETATAYWVGAFWHGLANSGMTAQERASLDPLSVEHHLRVKGSQTQLFGWLVYTCLLWCLKLCWLFFYKRLGEGVDNMTAKINIGFVLVVVTFFGTFFTILVGCFPVYKHWQIFPDPGNFCQPAVSKLQAWTLIVTNLTTDFYIMTIPLPMVWNARISVPKKLGLWAMFSGGIITAVFGGLRCGFVLQDSTNGPQLAGEWSCRESFVAVFISNVPILFPMIHHSLHAVRKMTSGFSHNASGGGGDESKTSGSGSLGWKLSTISGKNKDKKKFKHPLSLPGETFYELYGSEEDIVENGQAHPLPSGKDRNTEDNSSRHNSNENDNNSNNGNGNDTRKGHKSPNDICVTTEWQVKSQVLGCKERKQELHKTVNGFQAR